MKKNKIIRYLEYYYDIVSKKINKKANNNKFLKKASNMGRENKLLIFFGFLFLIIFFRLFQLQVLHAEHYEQRLISQHSSNTTLEAQRGNIFVTDSSGNERKLTENIDIYTLFIDPGLVNEQEKFVEKVTPVLYEHFCVTYGLETPDEIECIRNIEDFSGEQILPEEEQTFFLTGDTQQLLLDEESFQQEMQEAADDFEKEDAYEIIAERLIDMTQGGVRDANYFGYFDNDSLLMEFENLGEDYIAVEGNYLYLLPGEVDDINTAARQIYQILERNGYNYTLEAVARNLQEREIRYVRVATNVSGQIVRKIRDMKDEYFFDRHDGVPLLHGLGYEESQRRYYPYGPFMSHVLGYLNNEGQAFYGVEEYFDKLLSGRDGQMVGVSVPWIGMIGSNTFDIQEPIDGSDVYLTIDPTIQENVERITQTYYNELEPDTLSVIVMDPHTGKIKASVNYPDYDPNFYSDYYTIEPLSYEERYIVDEDQYIDIPVLIEDNGELRMATYDERKDPSTKKYIFSNKLGPQVFVDRNIAYPSEPGSTFKSITVALGLDSDEIGLYDFYEDEGSVEIGPYTISNIQDQCIGNNTFLHALDWSCNVGMVRIVQRTGRYVFYSYLEKLGFGRQTGVELAGEDSGNITGLEDFSMARFFNNSFGQGLLTTPIQLATAYSAMINGGYMLNPTVLDKIYDPSTGEYTEFEPKKGKRIFSEDTSEQMLESMGELLDMEDEEHLGSMVGIPFYSVGGKSGTSQIAFRGSYQTGRGWTYGGFAGVTTAEDPRYVVISQVRRPRQSQWGGSTAGFVNRDVSKFLIEYSGIQK